VRGFTAAIARAQAAADARALSLLAIGTRGEARQLDQTLDRLTEAADPHAHVHFHRQQGRAGATAPLGR
jgi:hypothetical protein